MSESVTVKSGLAKQLAAALGFVGLCRADRVKIEALGVGPSNQGPILRGRHSLWRMVEYLNGIEPTYNVPLAQGLRDFCLRNTGKGILVLISDLMDKSGYEQALKFLVAQQMDVYVLHLFTPEELNPDIKGDRRRNADSQTHCHTQHHLDHRESETHGS